MTDGDLVLVTGASGYVASHVVRQLQEDGYRVRGTVRSLTDQSKVQHLYGLCQNASHKLELVEADLLDVHCWKGAMQGCVYVQHVASPFPPCNPRNQDDVIKPAVDGTLNVLRAAAESPSVKRVVLTSSICAIISQGGNSTPRSEKDWADDKAPGVLTYIRSKIRAEKAAWEFWNQLPADQKFEFAVVNPALVFGPPLHKTPGSSTGILKQLLQREMPAVPDLHFAMIDVRDAAVAHVKCMTLAEAVGHRHLVSCRSVPLIEVAQILDREFKSQGYSVPTRPLPDFAMVLASWFDKKVMAGRWYASREMSLDTTRMSQVLAIEPREVSSTFIDMAYAMIDNGFVKKTRSYRGQKRSPQPDPARQQVPR